MSRKPAELVEAKGSGGVTVYAAVNPDKEARLASSSGGIFTLLAESVLAENGVVFGARFDKDWNVIHDYTETKEGLEAFREANTYKAGQAKLSSRRNSF